MIPISYIYRNYTYKNQSISSVIEHLLFFMN